LAELYEKLGRKDLALTFSGLTIASSQAMESPQNSDFDAVANSRARLHRLARPEEEKTLLEQTAQDYRDGSSVAVPNGSAQKGRAEFAILQTQPNTASQARRITGDAALQSFASAVAAKTPTVPIPGDEGVDIVRWAALDCPRSDAACTLTIANAREAARDQRASERKPAPPIVAGDPDQYSSETLGMALTLPQGWTKRSETAATSTTPASVVFAKEDSLCWLMLSRIHLEATEDTFNKLFESMLKDGSNYRQLSQGSVSRDGLKGVRTSLNFEENEIEMHAVMENFSEADVHYQIVAVAPKDQFERYASDLEAALASVRFTNSHVNPKDVKP
jgi:hypothetical protein